MGPPMNRTLLLLQRELAAAAEAAAAAASSSHHHDHPHQPSGLATSYGSYNIGSDHHHHQNNNNNNAQYSDDYCESNHSQEGVAPMHRDDILAAAPPAAVGRDENHVIAMDESGNGGDDAKQPREVRHNRDTFSSPVADGNCSVKSYDGSNDAGSAADTDDCGGSLDVETHSVGTRSIHSQDEAPPLSAAVLAEQELPEAAVPLLSSAPVENGRRSPGGTIYKGRGIRRYQGRYMHLPLKRFHQNGVHLEDDDDYEQLQQLSTANGGDHSGGNGLHHGGGRLGNSNDDHDHDDGVHPDWNDTRRQGRSTSRRPRRNGHHKSASPRRCPSRSRSRSRSPNTPVPKKNTDDDDERKPEARRTGSGRDERGYKRNRSRESG